MTDLNIKISEKLYEDTEDSQNMEENTRVSVSLTIAQLKKLTEACTSIGFGLGIKKTGVITKDWTDLEALFAGAAVAAKDKANALITNKPTPETSTMRLAIPLLIENQGDAFEVQRNPIKEQKPKANHR